MWSEGYVTEVEYTHGYFGEAAPARLRLAALLKGWRSAVPQSPSYLELGFGQGLSLNIHAAATGGTYWGTDFNASHAANAQGLADVSGADLTVLEESFAELQQRSDLPRFDVVALHGIWSWISDANRSLIVDIARRHLKPGGLFYVSYNVSTGWAPAMPIQHLMTEHARRLGAGSLAQRVEASVAFAERMAETDAGYFANNPVARERLTKIKSQPTAYVAHEYFNANWHPMPFATVAAALEGAKLSFAASAHLLEHVDTIHFSEAAQKILSEISDPVFEQTARDYLVNRQFRRDIFVKGGHRMSAFDHTRALREMRFVLLVAPEDRPTSVAGAAANANLQDAIYGPLVEALAADGGAPKRIDRLLALCPDLDLPKLFQAITILCGLGAVSPVQDEAQAAAARGACDALNTEICRRAEGSDDMRYLASPVLGGGIPVNRFEQLFLRARAVKEEDPSAFAWALLKAQGQSLQKDGKALQGDDANLAAMRAQQEVFESKRLPIFRTLGIA